MRTWPRVGRPAVARVGGHSVRRVHSRRARRSARLARWFSARTGRAHCTCPGDHGAGRIPRSDGRHAHLPRRPANVSDVGMPTYRARPRPTCACTTCPAITATRASRAHGRWRPPGRWRRGRSGPVVRWWSGRVIQGQIEDVVDFFLFVRCHHEGPCSGRCRYSTPVVPAAVGIMVVVRCSGRGCMWPAVSGASTGAVIRDQY